MSLSLNRNPGDTEQNKMPSNKNACFPYKIDEIWKNIQRHQGETFLQIRGKPFMYSVVTNNVHLHTTNRSISKKTFEHALEFMPLSSTTPIQHLQAPSYIYAILTDKRIYSVNPNEEW